jgi:hypothetical protein
MTKIQRSDFTGQHAGKSIDLAKLDRQRASDPATQQKLDEGGLSVDQLRRADSNRDGKLDAAEAFKVADNFDRDGSGQSLIAVDRAGQPTQAGKAAGALGALLAKRELQPDRPANDDILFVGMNPDAKHEARNLAQNARGQMTTVLDGTAGNDQIKVGSTTYDLNTPEGRSGFVGTLGLPAEQSQKVADAIASGGDDAKDELAQIAQVWAKAERGGTIPSRLVLSGHHVGSAVWGDDNGRLTWDSMKQLSQAMPSAAGQVQDLNISACYSGGPDKAREFKEIFPNVKTIWSYSGSAPGSWSGAMAHQKYWERATRGDNRDLQSTVDQLKEWGTRKAENIYVRDVDQAASYSGPPLDQLKDAINRGEPEYQQFFTGERAVENTQSGPLRDYYNQIQAALQHPDLEDWDRRSLSSLRDQCIRRLFYETNIGPRFQQAHGSRIQQGYQALGLPPPDFSRLSRGDALRSIDQFRAKLDQTPGAAAAAHNLLPLLNGLWNLEPQHIPETWI